MRVRSEYRDEAWKGLLEHAEDLEALFTRLAILEERLLRQALDELRLLDPSGPNPTGARAPSTEAVDLAYSFARLSLRPLAEAIEAGGGQATALGVFSLVPPDFSETRDGVPRLPDETPYGIPLLAACSPDSVPPERNVLFHASRWLVARQYGQFEQVDFPARLTRLLAIEAELWKLASAYGGPSDRLPYAFRVRALGWFWTRQAHAPGAGGCGLCIRCGGLIPPVATGRPRTKTEPRCPTCAKDRPAARAWPDRAIAPDGVGSWWLHCSVQSCDRWFSAKRNRLRCDEHDSSRLTVSKRAPID